MNAVRYLLARFYQVRAERARAAAVRFEDRAAKFFQRIGL